MKHEEDRIQYEIVKYLQSVGVYFFSVSNDAGGRTVQAMARAKSIGLRAGVSDMVLVLPGKVVFLEVKTATGTTSHLQDVFRDRVTELGHQYVVVRSVEDVKNLLDYPPSPVLG